MEAVTIHDLNPNNVLSFDLIDLLRIAGAGARASTWRCHAVEASGPRADVLHAASDEGRSLGGHELADIAAEVTQVITGDFAAEHPNASAPWLVIRAVDSSFFVVITEDHALIDRLRGAFRDVRDSPDDAEAPL